MSDQRIQCVECGRTFVWSAGEQRFYRERGLDPPRRCPDCRAERRGERRSGMRGLAGPPAQPVAHREPKPVAGGSDAGASPALPLWRELPRSEYYRHLSRFMDMDPKEISSLDVWEFALLMQWIFEQHELETQHIDQRGRRLDLGLRNRKQGWDELAMIYFGAEDIPARALWELLTKLRETPVKRVYLGTTGAFTSAHKRLQQEFPLFLDMVEKEGLKGRLRQAQQLCRMRLAQGVEGEGGPGGRAARSRRGGPWSSIKRWFERLSFFG